MMLPQLRLHHRKLCFVAQHFSEPGLRYALAVSLYLRAGDAAA
jgi:hypothetical protein